MEGIMQFGQDYMLWALLSIPLLIGLYMLSMYLRKVRLRRFSDETLNAQLIPDSSISAYRWKIILFLIGWTLLVIGTAGPRIGSKLKEVETRGREVIIALDVSNSMLAEDIKPSRLKAATQLIQRLVDEMDNDKVGLIVFAGDAYTQIPITDDYASVKMFLSTTGPDIVSKQGTAIGSAIELAAKSFPTATESEENEVLKNRAIVVITDGENHEDDAIAAAGDARKKGISVYTVGLGDPQGVPIPLYPGSKEKRRNSDGTVVVSKLNEKLLIDIAQAGDGAYIARGRMNALLDELDKLDTSDIKRRIFTEYEERFQYFTGFGFLFLFLESLVALRKNKWVSKLNVFK